MKHSVPTSKVGSYGKPFSESLFNFEGPRLSLDARPSGEIREDMSRVRRESRKKLPPDAERTFTQQWSQREKNPTVE